MPGMFAVGMPRRKHPRKNPSLKVLPSLLIPPPDMQLVNRTVQKAEWTDPLDMNPQRRLARQVSGWRRRDPLRECLARHGDASSFSLDHIRAADVLRNLYDGTTIGFTSAARMAGLPVTSVTYRPALGPTRTAQRQQRCGYKLRRVLGAFPPEEKALLLAVVLLNRPIARVAAAWGEGRHGLMKILVSALDKLVDVLADDLARTDMAA